MNIKSEYVFNKTKFCFVQYSLIHDSANGLYLKMKSKAIILKNEPYHLVNNSGYFHFSKK